MFAARRCAPRLCQALSKRNRCVRTGLHALRTRLPVCTCARTRLGCCGASAWWLQERGMRREASWDQAAQQYEQIISWAHMDPPFCL